MQIDIDLLAANLSFLLTTLYKDYTNFTILMTLPLNYQVAYDDYFFYYPDTLEKTLLPSHFIKYPVEGTIFSYSVSGQEVIETSKVLFPTSVVVSDIATFNSKQLVFSTNLEFLSAVVPVFLTNELRCSIFEAALIKDYAVFIWEPETRNLSLVVSTFKPYRWESFLPRSFIERKAQEKVDWQTVQNNFQALKNSLLELQNKLNIPAVKLAIKVLPEALHYIQDYTKPTYELAFKQYHCLIALENGSFTAVYNQLPNQSKLKSLLCT